MSAVLFEEVAVKDGHKIAFATLNAESSLNSLTLEMIHILGPKLKIWAKDPNIAMVFLQGAGEKAFCAGGDIRKLYDSLKSKSPYAEEFFQAEYNFDYTIHTYPKPILVFGHGIVMGGGLGIFAGGSCRVLTETSKIAMPEISIGLYPDVGATYFLNKMPEGCGLYLGLTGTRIHAGDSLYLGLADAFIPRAEKENLIQKLKEISWTQDSSQNKNILKDSIAKFAKIFEAQIPKSEVKAHQEEISKLTQVQSVFEFAKNSETFKNSDWVQRGIDTFKKGSPTSARVTFELLKRGKNTSLQQAFESDLSMSIQFGIHHDLIEGIRALLIDKDNKPNWKPQSLAEVSEDLVEEHFRKSPVKITSLV